MIEDYLRLIFQYPLLDAIQEKYLANKVRLGDEKCRETLINSNLRLVVSIARKYSNNGMLEDLIQEGNKGLILAADRFNPNLGFRFSTYASWWIKKEMLSYFSNSLTFRIPADKRHLMKKVGEIISEISENCQTRPSIRSIYEKLNELEPGKYTKDAVVDILRLRSEKHAISLNKPTRLNEESQLMDIVSCKKSDSQYCEVESKSTIDHIYEAISNLEIDETTKKIMEQKLYHAKNNRNIAKDLGIREEAIRQRYEKGLRLLRLKLRPDSLLYQEV